MNTQPYLTPNARPLDGDITIDHLNNSSWDYGIRLGNAGHLFLTATDANDLFHVLAKRLYDDDNLSMDTAEHVQFLCNSVLVDATFPTCDICGQREEDTPGMEWNGETGLHVACEKTHRCISCGGSGQVGAPWDPESCGTCRGTGYSLDPGMTKDEYDQYVADVLTEKE